MPSDIFVAALGSLLHRLRVQRRYSQAQVGSASEISGSLYSKIESGKHTPSRIVLEKIIKLYDLDESLAIQLEELRSRARNLRCNDAGLPDEIQSLLLEIRQAANALPTRYVRALRREIREVVGVQD